MKLSDLFLQATSFLQGIFTHATRSTANPTNPNIKRLVVLVMENRSFDHILGNLMTNEYKIEGLTGFEFNYSDPDSRSGEVRVTRQAPYVPDVDPSPSHEFHDVMLQLFMRFDVPWPIKESNRGFMYDYGKVAHSSALSGKIMRCFGADQLPALHALAREFAVCDHWFSSLPGPTWPNRFFIHCATSGGYVDNTLRDYNMDTIFENLSNHGVSWRVYYHDFPQSLALMKQRKYFWSSYEKFEVFKKNCAEGALPQYSFIEPRYFNEGDDRANDQHPIHGVRLGDAFIADVYECLKSSPHWNDTLLVITWDEHGGFFDHVLPPATVNPDGKNAPEFNFARLGARVPAVLVSPYIPRGTIDKTVYDHSSIPATLKVLFGLPNFLTKRDSRANTFDRSVTLSSPRPIALETLPRIPATESASERATSIPPTELHSSLLALAESLPGTTSVDVTPARTEQESATRAKSALAQFVATQKGN